MNNTVKGYKIFNPRIRHRERDFLYDVGKTYKHSSGFRFCIKVEDCFNSLTFNEKGNKILEVEALGPVETRWDKCISNEIKIIRELSREEVLKLANTGKENTGYKNTGYKNTGNKNSGSRNTGVLNSGNRNAGDMNPGERNTGLRNSGYGNSGHENPGDWNSGNRNSGNENSGYENSGDSNSGYWNTGDWNSGDWNSGNGNSGVFCTQESKIKIFDVQSNMTLSEWRQTEAAKILAENFEQNVWVYEAQMTEEEKKENPSYKTTGGYLKTLSFEKACNNMWQSLTEEEKEIIKNIPNFSSWKFEEITGIKIEEER